MCKNKIRIFETRYKFVIIYKDKPRHKSLDFLTIYISCNWKSNYSDPQRVTNFY